MTVTPEWLLVLIGVAGVISPGAIVGVIFRAGQVDARIKAVEDEILALHGKFDRYIERRR